MLVPARVFSAAPENPVPPANGSLQTIVVQGQKLSVETQIDRKVYRVPEDAQSTLGTLSDVLSVIPSVDLDPDGVVSLRGDSNVLILIDGKPTTQLQGSKAGENLQSISALDIERIEILTTPPAQFKAEGAAGVINIITRERNAKESASGLLQESLGDGRRSLVTASGSYGSKEFQGSVNAGYRQDYRQRAIQSQLIGPDPTTGRVLDSRDYESQHIRRNVPSIGLSGEYDLNEQQALMGTANRLSRGGLRTYTQLDDSALPNDAVTSSTRRLTSGHDPENDYDTGVLLSQKLNKSGETIDVSVHRSISHQHEHYDYVNDSFVPPAPTLYNYLDLPRITVSPRPTS